MSGTGWCFVPGHTKRWTNGGIHCSTHWFAFNMRHYETKMIYHFLLWGLKDNFGDMFRTSRDRYDKRRWGRVEDPYLLDNITMTIREGIIGANGFRCARGLPMSSTTRFPI